MKGVYIGVTNGLYCICAQPKWIVERKETEIDEHQLLYT